MGLAALIYRAILGGIFHALKPSAKPADKK
jgi:hypothetical protein